MDVRGDEVVLTFGELANLIDAVVGKSPTLKKQKVGDFVKLIREADVRDSGLVSCKVESLAKAWAELDALMAKVKQALDISEEDQGACEGPVM